MYNHCITHAFNNFRTYPFVDTASTTIQIKTHMSFQITIRDYNHDLHTKDYNHKFPNSK